MQWKNGIDPMEMSYLLGIAGGCLAAVLILVCLCIYAIRTRKCCFKGKFLICLLLLFQADSHILFILKLHLPTQNLVTEYPCLSIAQFHGASWIK